MNFFTFDLRKVFLVIALIVLPLMAINMQRKSDEELWFTRPFTLGGALIQRGFASFSSGDNRNSAVDYEGDVRGYNLGARYSLSKRTNAFAILGKLEIDTAANARTEAKQMGVGITHSF